MLLYWENPMRKNVIFTLFLILFLVFITSMYVSAVEVTKVSAYGKGKQVWFEAEHFDERDSDNVYKLGKEEGAKDPTDGAYGDIVTNAGGKGWILYRFDISLADGKSW